MVMHVCRQVLDDPDDAQDAFQATFLVLLRRAGSIRKRDSVASWLFGVALRVARRARYAAVVRRFHERQGGILGRRASAGRGRLARNAWRRCTRRSRGCRADFGSPSCSAISRACPTAAAARAPRLRPRDDPLPPGSCPRSAAAATDRPRTDRPGRTLPGRDASPDAAGVARRTPRSGRGGARSAPPVAAALTFHLEELCS